MAGLAEEYSVSSRPVRPLHSETCRWAAETTNVSCGHKALGDDWLLPGTGISLIVRGGMDGRVWNGIGGRF